MIQDSAIRVLADWEEGKIEGRGTGSIIKIVLGILGDCEALTVSVKDEPMKLADIVPLARAVSAKITEKEVLGGATIPCGKGCSACCDYLVPLAIPEVFRLREEIGEMPLLRQLLIEQECLKAARQILGQRPPESFTELAAADTAESAADGMPGVCRYRLRSGMRRRGW